MNKKGSATLLLVLVSGGVLALAAESAPQRTTYAIARTTGRPYRCTYQYRSFMGSTNSFTADILGDEFITVPLVWKAKMDERGVPTELPPTASEVNFARRGSIGYSWPCNPQDPPAPDVGGCRYDLARIKAETGVSLGDGLFYAPPTDEASCERIDAVTITIPSLTFGDQTQMFIDIIRADRKENTEALSTLEFTVYLPSALPSGWTIRDPAETGEGIAHQRHPDYPDFRDEVYLEYKSVAHERILGYQHKTPATLSPPENCAGALERHDEPRGHDCRLLFSTRQKRAVHAQDLAESGRLDRYSYFTVINGTVISLNAFDPISNDELEAFFDSLRVATAGEIGDRVHVIQ